MLSNSKIYDTCAAIIKTDNPTAEIKSLPSSIIKLIAHDVPFQIFPDDDEKSILNRIARDMEEEITFINKVALTSVIEHGRKYKNLPNDLNIDNLLKKNNLLDDANLAIAQANKLFDKLINNVIEAPANKRKPAWLTRIPVELLKKIKTINETNPFRAIDLSGNKFKTFPHELLNLDQVEFLNLSENRLSELPENFSKLKSLKILHLSSNEFEHFPSSLCECKSLEVLSLNRSKFKLIPARAGELTNLTTLNLEYCEKLLTLPAEMKSLTKLNLLSIPGKGFEKYSLSRELAPILQQTYSYGNQGRHTNYSLLEYAFQKDGLSPSENFQTELKKATELTPIKMNRNSIHSSFFKKDFFKAFKSDATPAILPQQAFPIDQAKLGLESYKNGDYKKAADIFRKMLKEKAYENDISILYNLSSALIKINTLECLIEARGHLELACALSDNNIKYLNRLKECQKQISAREKESKASEKENNPEKSVPMDTSPDQKSSSVSIAFSPSMFNKPDKKLEKNPDENIVWNICPLTGGELLDPVVCADGICRSQSALLRAQTTQRYAKKLPPDALKIQIKDNEFSTVLNEVSGDEEINEEKLPKCSITGELLTDPLILANGKYVNRLQEDPFVKGNQIHAIDFLFLVGKGMIFHPVIKEPIQPFNDANNLPIIDNEGYPVYYVPHKNLKAFLELAAIKLNKQYRK